MWNKETIQAVWEKAEYVSADNENKGFRKDQCVAWIRWNQYGKRNTSYGWELDRIKPVTKGGTDTLSNLRPLHWGNNASRQDERLTVTVKELEG